MNDILDDCQDAYEVSPDEFKANKLEAVAREYCRDDMISEEELASILKSITDRGWSLIGEPPTRKFYIKERQACVVTWTFAVEAVDELEALKMYGKGNHTNAIGEPEIGDSLDYVQFDPIIEEAKDV